MNITIIGTGCDALRDWGHAKDYVRMQLRWEGEGVNKVGYWLNPPAVIASGARQSMTPGSSLRGVADDAAIHAPESMDCHVANAPRNDGKEAVIASEARQSMPPEVPIVKIDPSKAKQKLGWVPEITAQEMCAEMVAYDLQQAKQHALLKKNGYSVNVSVE